MHGEDLANDQHLFGAIGTSCLPVLDAGELVVESFEETSIFETDLVETSVQSHHKLGHGVEVVGGEHSRRHQQSVCLAAHLVHTHEENVVDFLCCATKVAFIQFHIETLVVQLKVGLFPNLVL